MTKRGLTAESPAECQSAAKQQRLEGLISGVGREQLASCLVMDDHTILAQVGGAEYISDDDKTALGVFLCKMFGKDAAAIAEPNHVWNGRMSQAFFYDAAKDSSSDAKDMSDSLAVVIGDLFISQTRPDPTLPDYEVLQCSSAGEFSVVSVKNALVLPRGSSAIQYQC
eukprot:TRINITY_DN104528_c0_g1_i1.p1 TRINITY_DN104528_c0_g1~~TRINITY_DN104528_c0_g1_i1.p1  ORF type:complete len:168 (-),score=18.96 TRINITY_DN104528_c0_g1_i1:43-546(-)